MVSEFRTREDQVKDLTDYVYDGHSFEVREYLAREHILEAEARGAAEAVLKMAFSTEQKAIEDQKAGKRGEAFWRICLINALTDQEGWDNEEAQSHIDLLISEFKEVGASEQRRKDAEGMGNPSAYEHVMTYETGETNERLSYSPENAFGKPGRDYSAEYPVVTTPLYTRPFNVAALETRVKELEGHIAYFESEAIRFSEHYPPSSDGRNTFIMFAEKIKARAALKREGGV